MSGRMDFPKLCLFLLLLGTRMPKDIRCGLGAKWEFRESFSDVLKGVIQIHERIFQLGWNEPLLTVVVFFPQFWNSSDSAPIGSAAPEVPFLLCSACRKNRWGKNHQLAVAQKHKLDSWIVSKTHMCLHLA